MTQIHPEPADSVESSEKTNDLTPLDTAQNEDADGPAPKYAVCAVDAEISNEEGAGSRNEDKSSASEQAVESKQDELHHKVNVERAKKLDQISGFRRSNKMRDFLATKPEGGVNLWRWHVAHVMNLSLVKCLLVICIVANAITIGLEADYGSENEKSWPSTWQAIEFMFLLIFTTELVLNLFAFGNMFWEDKWNWLDAFIIAVSLLDFFINLVTSGTNTALSVFRLVRILRIIRVISFLDKMVYLVSAFLKGMESVMWVLVLWVIALYIFAVLAKGFFGDSDHLRRELKGVVDIEHQFGTIPRAMVTLIAFYTYDSTSIIQRNIGEIYPWAWGFFLTFMVLVSIGVMELMTSLFIDSLLEEKRRMEKKTNNEKLQRRKEVQVLITGLFEAFDEDKSETLDKVELAACLAVFDDPDTKALLDYVEIDPSMMRAAIKVADIDGDGEVSSDEFTQALESIHEPPMKSDLREIHQRVGILQIEHRSAVQHCKTQLEDFNNRLASLEQAASDDRTTLHSRLDTLEVLLRAAISGAAQPPGKPKHGFAEEKKSPSLPPLPKRKEETQGLRSPPPLPAMCAAGTASEVVPSSVPPSPMLLAAAVEEVTEELHASSTVPPPLPSTSSRTQDAVDLEGNKAASPV